jgi:hypothetical protein
MPADASEACPGAVRIGQELAPIRDRSGAQLFDTDRVGCLGDKAPTPLPNAPFAVCAASL